LSVDSVSDWSANCRVCGVSGRKGRREFGAIFTRVPGKQAGHIVKQDPNASRKGASRSPYYRAVMLLATIPLYIGVAPIVGWWLGRWVDRKAGTEWVFQAIGSALGIGAAILETIRIVRRAQRDLNR